VQLDDPIVVDVPNRVVQLPREADRLTHPSVPDAVGSREDDDRKEGSLVFT
jgi:hypothetical protein